MASELLDKLKSWESRMISLRDLRAMTELDGRHFAVVSMGSARTLGGFGEGCQRMARRRPEQPTELPTPASRVKLPRQWLTGASQPRGGHHH